MSPDHANISVPGLSHVSLARETIMARKQNTGKKPLLRSLVFSLLHFDLKFYHLGISVLLIMIGTFYISESNYNANGSPVFSNHNYNTLSIKSSTTISVNSSTMLASIPTLRN